MLKQFASALCAVAFLSQVSIQGAFAVPDDCFTGGYWTIGQAGDQFAAASCDTLPLEEDRKLKRFLESGNYGAASQRYLQLAHAGFDKEYCLGYHELYSGDPNKAAFYLHRAITTESEMQNVVAWMHRQGHDDAGFRMLKMRSDDWPGGPANDTIGQSVKQKLMEDFLADRTRPIEKQNLDSFGMKRFKQNRIAVFFVSRNPKFDQEFRYIFLDALKQWSASTNFGLSVEVVSDAKKANMVAKWSEYVSTLQSNFFDTGSARACGILGYCRTVTDPKDKVSITQATVEVPVFLQIGTSMRDEQCREACLHQIGHAIGINQHSNQSQDVLGLRHAGDAHPLTRLTEHDRTMARVLYAPTVFRRALTSNRLCWRPPSKLNERSTTITRFTPPVKPSDAFEIVDESAGRTDEFKPPSLLNKAADDFEDAPLDAAGMCDQFSNADGIEWNTGSQVQSVCRHSLVSKHHH